MTGSKDSIHYNVSIFNSLDSLINSKYFNEIGINKIINHFEKFHGNLNDSTQILVFPFLADFAKYEVIDGWYSNLINPDFNGAPSLYDVIDYDKLGALLSQSWDKSVNYKLGNRVICVL